jgi:hypothetical protein
MSVFTRKTFESTFGSIFRAEPFKEPFKIKENESTKTITINNKYSFRFINKFTTRGTLYVNVIKTNVYRFFKKGNDIEFTFARSKSECGFWRLCLSKTNMNDIGFYLEKGSNYTMSSFIILEIQFFINKIINNLPDITETPNSYCMRSKKEGFEYYNNILMNENRELSYQITECDIVPNTIKKINKYHYDSEYNNYHPVDFDPDKRFEYNSKMTREEKMSYWPSNTAEETVIDTTIDHGETKIKVNGDIFSVILKRNTEYLRFYYMIYDITINIPDSIQEYHNIHHNNDKNIPFNKEIKASQYIIPIYCIPLIDRNNLDEFYRYGLYNTFSSLKYNNVELKMSKILEYTTQCDSGSTEKICTTTYSFIGEDYNNIKKLKTIKEETIKEKDPSPKKGGSVNKKRKTRKNKRR